MHDRSHFTGNDDPGLGMNAAVAVDVGGTSFKGMAVRPSGEVVARSIIPTPRDADAALVALRNLVDELTGALIQAELQPARIGIACPGLVQADEGVIEYAANLGWRDVALGHVLAEEFGAEVFVENDARAGAFAEFARTPMEARSGLAFIPIGTGVSAAFFARHAIQRGAKGMTGELGHLRAVPGGEPCSCGAAGCVEVYGSAANILRRYRRAGGRADSMISLIAALDDDPIADRVWTEAIDALAIALGALISLLDPTTIIVGGGLSLAGDALLRPLRQRVRAEVPWRAVPELSASVMGSHSALIGAALLGSTADRKATVDLLDRLRGQLDQRVGVSR